VTALRDGVPADPASRCARLIETHISHVLLTGRYAYKVKKAVGLGFLDFRTLEARKFYCNEELRLNRRFAPDLYIGVVPITGTADAPVIGGDGPAIEYAVKMREFPQDALASALLARGALDAKDIDALAASVAAAHDAADVAPAGGRFGDPARIGAIAAHNFSEIRPLLADEAERARLDALAAWTAGEHAAKATLMARRRDAGRVRECHGDLHLGNIAQVDGVLRLFDCIEFNEEMRWIDVMSEIAFTVMDLADRGRRDLSHRFLDTYLALTGDYDGLGVLRFHLVYRAMVRAKVTRLRAEQLPAGAAKTAALTEYRDYVDLATHYTEPTAPAIVITHGLSGSGKSTRSQALVEHAGAIRVRTDVERARLFHPERAGPAAIEAGAYSPAATIETYRRVFEIARDAVGAGFSVIVDAAFLKRAQRDAFRALAADLSVPFRIVSFVAREAALRDRILRRIADGGDASQADLGVLEHQLRTQEPLAGDEAADAIVCDTEAAPGSNDGSALWQRIQDHIGNRTGRRAP
jgi:aminoglycoside phosphotransferase family enzyme/predicted kinase